MCARPSGKPPFRSEARVWARAARERKVDSGRPDRKEDLVHLDGANVLLTGGSRGIGPYIAHALLERGARVTLAARSAEDLGRTRDSLGGDRVAIAAGDVSVEADREKMITAAEEAFGPIDVLVNNAGIESVLPFEEYREGEIERVIDVNLLAPMRLTRLVMPGMLERARGHIVNMSSLSGKTPPPYHTAYASTKAGLVGFTASLRGELKDTGVSASVICPGYITEAGVFAEGRGLEPPKRSGAWGTPRDVARAVVRAVEKDVPEIIVARGMARIADVAFAISPRLVDRIARRTGGYRPQEETARKELERRRQA
jgi:short-subunit dehydrogenase